MENPEKVFDLKLRCYAFSKNVVLFINNNDFNRVYHSVIDQLLRSATSVGANVIEGKSGNSRKILVNCFSIALRSANETKYWLCLIRDTMNVNKEVANQLIKEADEISKIIAKSILALKRNQKE